MPNDQTSYDDLAQGLADKQGAPQSPSYDDLAQQTKDAQDAQSDLETKAAAWRASRSDLDPTKAANVVLHAQAAKLPYDYVASHYDEVANGINEQQLRAALANNPHLVEYMKDPTRAALVRDDGWNLAKIKSALFGEWETQSFNIGGPYSPLSIGLPHLKKLPALLGAVERGVDQERHTYLATKQATGAASPDDLDELDNLEAKFQKDGDFGGPLLAPLKMAPYLGEQIAARAGAGVAGSVFGPAGTAIGQASGGYAVDFYQNFGPLYRSLKQQVPDLSDNEARFYAATAAAGSAALANVISGKLIESIPGVKQGLARVAGKGIEQALSPTLRGAVAQALKNYGLHVVSGAALMAVQQGVNTTIEEAAKASRSMEGQEPAPDFTTGLPLYQPEPGTKMAGPKTPGDASRIASSMGHGFKTGFTDFLLLGGWSPAHDLMGEVGRARAARDGQDRLDIAVKAAKESKLATEAPQEARKFFGVLADQSGADTVYVDREAWEKLWGEEHAREAAAAVLDDKGKAYDESKTTGDLAIPTADYLAKLAPGGHAEQLRDDVRFDQAGISINRAREREEAFAKIVKQGAASAPKEGDPGRAIYEAEYKKSFDALNDREDLDPNAVADAHGKLISSVATSLASRHGGTPEEWYQKLGADRLQILTPEDAPGAEESATAMAAQRLAQPAVVGPLWFSQLERTAETAKQAKGTPESWIAILSKAPGVKAEEIAETGVKEWLAEQKGTVTREQVLQHLRDNAVEVEERILYSSSSSNKEKLAQQLSDYGITVDDIHGDPEFSYDADIEEEVTLEKKHEILNELFERGEVTQKEHDELQAVMGALEDDYVGEGENLSAETRREYLDRLSEHGVSFRSGYFTYPTMRYDTERLHDPRDITRHLINASVYSRQSVSRIESLMASIGRDHEEGDAHYESYSLGDHKPGSYKELLFSTPKAQAYNAPHFGNDGEGIFAHARISVHRDANGRPLLFVEEVQSDLHQKGREKGYRKPLTEKDLKVEKQDDGSYVVRSPEGGAFPGYPGVSRGMTIANALRIFREEHRDQGGVADAPFKGEAWEEMVAKRLVRYAAENDFDKIGWTTGEQQADRYSLSHHVDELAASFDHDPAGPKDAEGFHPPADSGHLSAFKDKNALINRRFGSRAELETLVGRDAAEKLIAKRDQTWGSRMPASISGLDLKIGGSGMKAAYDRRLPRIFEKIVKKYGGKVEQEPLAGSNGEGPKVWTATVPEALREKALSDGMPLFQAGFGATARLGHQGARGFIDIVNGPEGKAYRINLGKGADESTLAHETMHFLADSLSGVAMEHDAPAALRSDMESLARFMGYGSIEERAAARDPAKEERASHAFEQYLASGKAPSAELAGVFARMANWLKRIYGSAGALARQYADNFPGQQPLQLSDEVRGVFDRLLATDGEIEKAQRAQAAADPIPHLYEKMDEPARAEYDRVREQARQQAEAHLFRQITEATRKENREFRKSEATKIRKGVEGEVDKSPVYRALHFFQTGELRSTDTGERLPAMEKFLEGMKFKRQDLVDTYGKDFVSTMPRYVFAKKGEGAPPDQVAQALQYGSGDELVRAIQAAKPRDALVEQETMKRLGERFPSLLDDPQKLGEKALDAVHDAPNGARAIYEGRAMARWLDPSLASKARSLSWDAAVSFARRTLAGKSIREIAPLYYLNAERSASQRAFEALDAGKTDEAFDHKQAELLNSALYHEARQLQDDVRSLQSQTQRVASETRRDNLAKAGQPYLDGFDGLLQAVKLQDSDGKTRLGLDALLQQMKDDAADVQFDVDGIRDLLANPRPWKELRPAEAANLLDALKNIRTEAKSHNEVVDAERKATHDHIVETSAAEIRKLPFKGKPLSDKSLATTWQSAMTSIQAWDAALTEPETLFGFASDTLKSWVFDRYIKQRNFRDDLSAHALEYMRKAFEEMPKAIRDRRYDKVDLPELVLPTDHPLDGREYSRQWLQMLALNFGNQGNRERLLNGYGWQEDAALRAIGKLTPEELAFVQKIHDYLDKDLWPLVKAKEERKSGVAAPKVEAAPYTVTHEDGSTTQMSGGYFPVRYRSDVSAIGEKQATSGVAQFYPPNYQRASTAKSHTKDRAARGADAPLDLNFDVLPTHIAQVIHDVAFDEMIRDTGRILLDPRLQSALREHMGTERARMMTTWLNAVASARSSTNADGTAKLMQEIGWARNLYVSNAILGSIPVALAQLTHPFAALTTGKVSPKYWAQGIVQAVTHLDEAHAQFSELRSRDQASTRALQEELGQMGPLGPRNGYDAALNKIQKVSSILSHVDRLTSTMVALGARNEGLAQGMGPEELADHVNTIVRNVMPSRERAEKSALLRSEFFGRFLVFETFFNKLYSLSREAMHPAYLAAHDPAQTKMDAVMKSGQGATKVFATLLFTVAAGELAGGHGKDDDESWKQYWERVLLALPFAMVPIVRDLARGASKAVVTGKMPRDLGVRPAPFGSAMEGLFHQAAQLATHDKRSGEDKAFDALQSIITVGGKGKVPAKQIRRSLQYVFDLIFNDSMPRPRGPGDVASGLTRGKRPHQSTDIPTMLQDAASE